MSKYKLNTYKQIIETLRDIEIEEEKMNRNRFWICLFSIVFSILVLIFYAIIKESWNILIRGDVVKVFLIPIFSYLFMSLKEDALSDRKAQLYEAFADLYKDNKNLPEQKLEGVPMSSEELKEIMKGLIKSKLE